MNNLRNYFILIVVVFTILVGSSGCSDPTAIGTDLLEQDLVEVGFMDDLPLHSKTIAPMPTVSYDLPFRLDFFTVETFNQLSTYLFGSFQDPIFGTIESGIIVQPEKASVVGPVFTEGDSLISIELILPYDSASFYGDITQEMVMEVFQLSQNPEQQIYYNNSTFAFDDAAPLAVKTFLPSLDSVVVDFIDENGEVTSVTQAPQLRIELPKSLGEELLQQDTLGAYLNDTSFFEFFRGLYLRPMGATNGMVGFRIGRNSFGAMEIRYQQEGTNEIYQFGFFYTDAVRTIRTNYDYAGSMVGDFLDAPTESDSIVFIQGAAGAMTKISFPDVSALENAVVNKAELEMTLAGLPEDDTLLYQPIQQLSVFQVLNDDTIEPLEDLNIVFLARRPLEETFGGNLNEDDDEAPRTYRINITAAFQEMLNNNLKPEILISGLSSISRAASVNSLSQIFDNDVIVSSFSSIERANRSVIYGATHSQYPMKLNITFSKP